MGCLSAGYLVEGKGEVDVKVFRSLERQLTDVVVSVSADIVGSFLVHFLLFSYRMAKK